MTQHLNMKSKIRLQQAEKGFLLIEVLVSILLFALGIVALIGLQANTLTLTGDIQNRAEAAHLANAYLGKIWGSGLNGTALQNEFGTGAGPGTEFAAFSQKVTGTIPHAQAPTVNIQPVVVPSASLNPASADVTIVIAWTDTEGTLHSFTQDSAVGY